LAIEPKPLTHGATAPTVTLVRSRYGVVDHRRVPKPVDALDEQIIRRFYAEGWTKGNRSAISAHPPIAEECHQLFDRYRTAFPDLAIDVRAIEREGDDVVVRWVATGTHRGPMGRARPTGRRATVDGTTRMRLVDGTIDSAVAEWDDAGLRQQLGVTDDV
jgi:hypothetical protein